MKAKYLRPDGTTRPTFEITQIKRAVKLFHLPSWQAIACRPELAEKVNNAYWDLILNHHDKAIKMRSAKSSQEALDILGYNPLGENEL